MTEPEALAGLDEELARVNEYRRRGRPADSWATLEDDLERRFAPSRRLAVYGSLAPGRSNDRQLAELTGDWVSGLVVRGELRAMGWGIHLGYPALRWSMDGDDVPVELFISDDLAAHWPRLDRFEGRDYERILVPLLRHGEIVEVANLYQARTEKG